MPSSSAVVLFVLSTTAGVLISGVDGDWVFTWPYGEDGSCHCEEKDFGLRTYLTEESCLEAFNESEYEYCSVNGTSPLVEKQCDFAISTTEGFHNSYCVGKCAEVVSGLLTIDDYMKECDLEVVVDFDYAVATLPTGCYSNNVFGWSDYNPLSSVQKAPLKFFEKVSTASRCQELCQDVDGCASFVWRAVPDHESTSSFQNDPHTCILYDETFMDHVVNDPIPSSFGTPTQYCDVPAVGECASIQFPRESWNILEDQTCLYCGCDPRCIYYSDSHITGPAFCRKQGDRLASEVCDFTRPTWTTTTPEPECPTETCHEPGTTTTAAAEGSTTTNGLDNTEEGTSVTDVALTTTEPAVGASSTTTSGAEQTDNTSTTPDLTQMTAQSDTALTATGPAADTTTTTAAAGGSTTSEGVQPSVTPVGSQETSETATSVQLETTEQPSTEETTTGVELETTTSGPAAEGSTTGPGAGGSTTVPGAGQSTTAPGAGQSTTAPGAGESTTAPGAGQSTTAPGAGESTTAPGAGESTTAPGAGESTTAPGAEGSTTVSGAGESTTTVPATAGSTSKTSPGGCVPGCTDCPCFKESECDDCYSISDCMDDEC